MAAQPEANQQPAEDSQAGWIDMAVCEAILSKDIKICIPVDGSDNSMTSFAFATEGLLQTDRASFAQVLHVYDPTKTYLPVKCQKDALHSTAEALMTACVTAKRYSLNWVKKETSAGDAICKAVRELPADYVCMGFFGLKGKRDVYQMAGGIRLATNLATVLSQSCNASVICIKDDDQSKLPLRGRKAVFVVSVGLNRSSTKAFLDALRLSKPGDEIHVVYIKAYMERGESDYTQAVRAKYESFFQGLAEGKDEVLSKFHDRETKIVLEMKQKRETTPEAVVRYADSVDADFVAVGANAASRVQRGKKPVGSVSLQVCLLAERNFIISTWLDMDSRAYDEMRERARAP